MKSKGSMITTGGMIKGQGLGVGWKWMDWIEENTNTNIFSLLLLEKSHFSYF